MIWSNSSPLSDLSLVFRFDLLHVLTVISLKLYLFSPELQFTEDAELVENDNSLYYYYHGENPFKRYNEQLLRPRLKINPFRLFLTNRF